MKLSQLLSGFGLITLFASACEDPDVSLSRDIAGEWRIKQITYRRIIGNNSGADSLVSYSNSTISFAKCKRECDGSYVFDKTEKVPFFYYLDSSNNTMFVNVGSRTGPGLHPAISLNGQAVIMSRSDNRMMIEFEAGFRNKDGNTVANTHKARAVLER